MKIALVNPESYNPLEVLTTWRQIAEAMKDHVPHSFDEKKFLLALLDDHRSVAFGEIMWAQDLCIKSPNAHLVRSTPPTPIDFTADSAGQLWGLSFTHEKGEAKIFATTITLVCTVPQHQPPMRAVCANQLWIDINDNIELEKHFPFQQSVVVEKAEKLLKLFNVGLLQNDKGWEARRSTHDGWIELAGIATQPFVQPLIKLVEGKLNQ